MPLVTDKRKACGIIGGALKVSREWTVLQCEIECCTGDKCNSQLVPTLSSKASSGISNELQLVIMYNVKFVGFTNSHPTIVKMRLLNKPPGF